MADQEMQSPERAQVDPQNREAMHADQLPVPVFTPPVEGESITSTDTGNTYRIGKIIGEGSFGVVYACTDTWGNELAVKILKPRGTYASSASQCHLRSRRIRIPAHLLHSVRALLAANQSVHSTKRLQRPLVAARNCAPASSGSPLPALQQLCSSGYSRWKRFCRYVAR